MSREKDKVCPVENSGHLDNKFRKFFQNPKKILQPFVKEGDTAIDFGCGPGFFTIPMAELTGETGRTIAADLQQGMLDIVSSKIKNTPIEKRIILHKAQPGSPGIYIKADFILLFYMVHEVPDQLNFFRDIADTTKQTGQILVIEPPFHVSKEDFDRTLEQAEMAGLKAHKGPKMFMSRTAILKKQ